MVETAPHIAKLIDTLTNPRYATNDPTNIAPIELDGMLDGYKVEFVAHQNDIMEYGRDVWQRAQAGEYGSIAPYNPPIARVKTQAKGWCGIVDVTIAKDAGLGDTAKAASIEFPLNDQQAARVAKLWGVAVKELPDFISNMLALRFDLVQALAELNAAVDGATDKPPIKAAVDAFETEMARIVKEWNGHKYSIQLGSPKKIDTASIGL